MTLTETRIAPSRASLLARPLVVVDQEHADAAGVLTSTASGGTSGARQHRLVMCLDGETVEYLDDARIPARALVVGDYNALAIRNGRSLSQAWTEEDFTAWHAALEARGCVVRSFNNFTFGADRVEGGPLAALHLYRACVANPHWMVDATRPVEARDMADRFDSARLWEDAKWDFRRVEDDQKHGILPAWYADAQRVAHDAAPEALAWLKQPHYGKSGRLIGHNQANPRRLMAVYLSVMDIDGNPRRMSDGTVIRADYARRYVARLHGRARGVGGPIRACLRAIGRSDNREERAMADRAFLKITRALLEGAE